MASFTVSVPDAAVDRVLAMAAALTGGPLPATAAGKKALAEKATLKLLRHAVLAHERNARMAAAMAVDPNDPLHDPED